MAATPEERLASELARLDRDMTVLAEEAGTVFTLVQYRGDGLATVYHLETFSSRPQTPGVGGDPGNWPDMYEVYVGNIDGGDSVLIEADGELTDDHGYIDDPAYLAHREEQEAIEEGRATELVHCYLCFLEETGKADMSPRQDQGPLRGVVTHGTAYGFDRAASARQGYDGDPYDMVRLTCGHSLI